MRDIEKMRANSRRSEAKKKLRDPKLYHQRLAKRVRTWREKNPGKIKAQRRVFVELRAGRMRRGLCFCGSRIAGAHHKDYRRPLEVMWLCRKHHAQIHRDGTLLDD
jgi:hypothetical protein